MTYDKAAVMFRETDRYQVMSCDSDFHRKDKAAAETSTARASSTQWETGLCRSRRLQNSCREWHIQAGTENRLDAALLQTICARSRAWGEHGASVLLTCETDANSGWQHAVEDRHTSTGRPEGRTWTMRVQCIYITLLIPKWQISILYDDSFHAATLSREVNYGCSVSSLHNFFVQDLFTSSPAFLQLDEKTYYM